jgi:4-hydroxy-tetrahydrodipicolinate synthase
MQVQPFRGSYVALVTPMHPDGSIDWVAYTQLIDWHIEAGTHGLVVVGTTGESPTVNVNEHSELIQKAVTHSKGRITVIAGTGANSTAEAIELSAFAKKIGAQAALSVVPYYNKPSQEGLYQHFKAIAESVELPLILYNVPGRTVADLHNDTTVRLAQLPNIIGIKDATGDLARGLDLLYRVPQHFGVFSGDDASSLALMLCGGQGSISVTANVAPYLMAKMCEAALSGKHHEAHRLNRLLMPLHKNLFVEANPIPVKWALYHLKKIGLGIRLPLVPLSETWHSTVQAALHSAEATH